MSKFVCKCGQVIDLTQGWSDAELALVPARTIEEIGDALAADTPLTDERFYDLIDAAKATVYRCPKCGRLHVESRDQPNHFTSYVAEPD